MARSVAALGLHVFLPKSLGIVPHTLVRLSLSVWPWLHIGPANLVEESTFARDLFDCLSFAHTFSNQLVNTLSNHLIDFIPAATSREDR